MSRGIQAAWSTSAPDNGDADDLINVVEGSGYKMPDINNSVRGVMAAVKGWQLQVGPGATYGGSSNAYTIASPSNVVLTDGYAAGMMFALRANHTNSDDATLNVDGQGAKSIRDDSGAELAPGTLVSGGVYLLAYDGDNDRFTLVGTVNAGSYQPLDATLTALAALAWSSGNQFPYLTAADTFALGTLSNDALSLNAAADYAAMRGLLDLEAGTDFLSPAAIAAAYQPLDADLTSIAALTTTSFGRALLELANAAALRSAAAAASLVANTFTGTQRISNAAPILELFETDAGTDEKLTSLVNTAGVTYLIFMNDANNAGSHVLRMYRSGTTPTLLDIVPPFRGRVAVSSETSGTLTADSANKQVNASGNITLNGGVFSAGDRLEIYAGASSRTITQGSGSITLRLDATSSTGNRTLAARGRMSVYFLSATEAICSGAGVT